MNLLLAKSTSKAKVAEFAIFPHILTKANIYSHLAPVTRIYSKAHIHTLPYIYRVQNMRFVYLAVFFIYFTSGIFNIKEIFSFHHNFAERCHSTHIALSIYVYIYIYSAIHQTGILPLAFSQTLHNLPIRRSCFHT